MQQLTISLHPSLVPRLLVVGPLSLMITKLMKSYSLNGKELDGNYVSCFTLLSVCSSSLLVRWLHIYYLFYYGIPDWHSQCRGGWKLVISDARDRAINAT